MWDETQRITTHEYNGRKTVTRRISWYDLQKLYRQVINNPDSVPGHTSLHSHAYAWRRDQGGSSFYELSSADVIRIMDEGYDLPALEGTDVIPVELEGEGPRWIWNDEDGDYYHDEYLSGEPEFYCDRRITEAKPGIFLNVDCSFNCTVKPYLITAYGKWVGQVVEALQARGFDLSITVSTTGEGAYRDEPTVIHENMVLVKQFGESLLARDFNVIFTGAGYRHLLFAAIMEPEIYPGDGAVPDGGLGSPIMGQDWAVEWDEESRRLNIIGATRPDSQEFPEKYMTTMLSEIAEQSL